MLGVHELAQLRQGSRRFDTPQGRMGGRQGRGRLPLGRERAIAVREQGVSDLPVPRSGLLIAQDARFRWVSGNELARDRRRSDDEGPLEPDALAVQSCQTLSEGVPWVARKGRGGGARRKRRQLRHFLASDRRGPLGRPLFCRV